jgi:hypothetical protein
MAARTSLCRAVLAVLLAAAPAAAQQIDPQLQEIRTLIREKRYPIALESLRLVARQIQDLRLEAIAPAFPPAPAGWTALPPLSLLEEDEIWSSRIAAQQSYAAATKPARLDVTIDVHSPAGPAAALGFNPVVVAGDSRSRLVPVGTETALLRFNPDTGEADLRLLIGKDTLVTVRGRGIGTADLLVGLARGIDFALLRRASGI